MKEIKSIESLSVRGKRVFLRLDFNVPLGMPDATGVRTIGDDNRIRETLPTIRYLIEQGSKIVIASHLGRPKGQKNPEFSMEPAARRLSELLGVDITLADDCIGEGIELMVRSLKSGQVMMLENLRFYGQEEANDPNFCQALSRLADVYVTDAFGTAHRKHASTYGLPSLMKDRGMGFLIQKELKYLNPLLESPTKPFFVILGGSKVSDKIKTIETLMRNVNGLLIGGAMAHAFTLAQDQKLSPNAKSPSPEDVEAARSVLRQAKRQEIPVLLPIDSNNSFDIGPKTIEQFKSFLSDAKTVFWNGPLGWFEKPEYATGTFEIAKFLAKVEAVKIVGGGDTVSAIHQSGFSEKFDHLSTGGGAVLEYLEGHGIPGIDVLVDRARRSADL